MRTTINGGSDDLIEVGGSIREEFGARYNKPTPIVLSNGVELTASYDDDGVWRFVQTTPIVPGVEIIGERGEDSPGPRNDEDGCPNYSMKVIITDDLEWVMVDGEVARP